MASEKITETVEIPDKVEARSEGRVLTVKGPKGENTREFRLPGITFKVEDNNVILESSASRRSHKMNIRTLRAHIRNMIEGVQEGFTYKLKICSGHFPMNVTVNGKEFIVKNFLGEKVPRVLKLKDGANVKVDGQEVTVEGIDIENVGQVAADIEQLTRVTNKDIRVFQDGIYITHKPRKAM